MAFVIFVVVILRLAFCAPFQSDELTLSGWAPAVAMGGIRTVVDPGGFAALTNPSFAARAGDLRLCAGGGRFFSGLVDFATAGVVAKRGGCGLSFAVLVLGGDDLLLTELADPQKPLSAENRPRVVGRASHYTAALAFGAGRMLGDLSLGASVEVVRKKLPDVGAWGASARASVMWEHSGGLALSAVVENAPVFWLRWSDGVTELAAPRLCVGARYRLDVAKNVAVALAGEGSFCPDDGFGPLRFGVKASWREVVGFSVGTRDGNFCAGAQAKFGSISVGAATNFSAALGTSYIVSVGYER